MLSFRLMTAGEFSAYEKNAILSYAADKKFAESLTDENALKLSQAAYQELLPQGLNSPEQIFYIPLFQMMWSLVCCGWQKK
ncbi:MAG: hypothetical protein H0V66_15210 [Bdellovibrionales bacterium]|nr:hypothetical protein [Bdellovibrionales bacterium]